MTLLEKANKSNGLLQLKLNGHQLNTVVNSGNAVNRVKSVIANLQQQQPIQAAIQLPVLRSSNNSVTTNPSINNSTVPITTTTTIAPSAVAAASSSSAAHRAHQPPRSLASFMANRCCVCSRLLRNYRGNRLAKSYEITIDPNDLLSSRSHNHHHSNESVRGHLNGDASTLVNNNSNNTNRSNHRISRLLTKHLALSSAAPAKNSSQNGSGGGGDSSDSVSQKRKLCQSCYDHLNQIDSHMKSVIRLRSLMKAKLRKSLRLVSSGNKPVLSVLRRHPRRGGNKNNGFVKLVADSSDLIVKSENNNNNRVGSAATNRSASNKMNLSKQLMINAAANSNNDAGLASSAQASSSSISSSPSATSLSPATNYVNSSHLNQNGALAGLYIQPQTEQLLRLNPEILALLAASGSLSNNSNNASFELASLANMDLKPTLISPPSSSSNRRKRKSQNPSRLLNKGDSMTFNLDENNNNQLQPNNNNQALNLAKLVAATTTAQVKSKLANIAKQQQQQQLKTKTTKTTINITDNQAGRSIGNKLRSSLAATTNPLSHFIPNNKENDAHGNKRRSLQIKSDLDDELDDEQMINDEELHQVDEIKNNDDQEENNELGDEEPIDETCGVQDDDPDMNGGDNSQYDDPMYDEEEDEEEDDEAHQHQMNGFDEEDDEENNNNSNNDELGGTYGAEEGDDEEEDEEEDHSLVGGGGGLLRSQGRGLSTSTSTTTLTHHNNIPIKHLFEAAHNAAQQRVKLNTNQVRNNSVGLKSKKFSLTNGDMEGSSTNQVANALLSMSGSKSSSSANNIHHSSNSSNNNNDPEFKHNCNICRKSFKTQNILRQHMRIHTGDKPFVCDLCNKAFSQMASLKYHQATHSDDRPYKCDGCAKTFKLKPPFKKHIKDCPQRLAILGANPGSTSSNNNAALISLLNASGLAGLVDHDDDNDDDIND